jgi:small-conductance mechanosensitive channel
MLDALLEPLERLAVFMDHRWSSIIVTMALLMVGWLSAHTLRFLVVRALRIMRLDAMSQRAGIDGLLSRGGVRRDLVDLLGILFYWTCVVLVFVLILRVWGVPTGFEQAVLTVLVRVFVAVLILLGGLVLATFLAELVDRQGRQHHPRLALLLSRVVRWTVVVLVVLTALRQLGIETLLLSVAVLIILGAVSLAFAIALGLGGRDIARRKLEEWVREVEEEESPQPRP